MPLRATCRWEVSIVSSSNSAFETIRPVIVLVSVCAVAGALLGGVHHVTAPVIASAEQRRAEQTYAELMPEAASFEEVTCEAEGCTAALKALDATGGPVGYVIVAEAKGYGGMVPLAVAFDKDGAVQRVTVMPNEETPGLGSRAEDDSYLSQYVGITANAADGASIDLISGATISSTAVRTAFYRAVAAYEEVR